MKRCLVLGLSTVLAACAGTDNSPVPTELKPVSGNGVVFSEVWHTDYADGGLYRFAPDVTGKTLYMAAEKGLAAFDPQTGHTQLEIRSDKTLAGGVGAADGVVTAGTLKGDVLAWDASGKLKWQVKVSSEVVSPPSVAEGLVVVRTVDGRITGLDVADGKQRWQFQRNQPSLILRNYAGTVVADGVVYAGLAAGRLVALSLADGRVLWESLVAPPKGATELERISDVTSTPVVFQDQVCAVAYQGRVACFAVSNGSTLWARDVSSYAGLAIDVNHVYVTDDVGNVQAFERTGGRSLWKTADLYGRRVSGPASLGDYIAVGDFEGYVHLLSASDGRLVARQRAGKSPVVVAPRLVAGQLLVQTQGGELYAYAVK